MARWFVLIAVILLTGCSGQTIFGQKIWEPGPRSPEVVEMEVKASSLDTSITGRTFHIFRDPEQTVTVEQALFSDALRRELAARGLTEVDSMEAAHYVLLSEYGDKTVQTTKRIPNWGVTGYTSRTHTGAYSGITTSTTPQYGITGFDHVPDTSSVRIAVVQAYDAQKIVREGLIEERWKVMGAADPKEWDLEDWDPEEPVYSVMIRGMAKVMGKNVLEAKTILVKEVLVPAPP